jgi:hypothetical protein
MAPLSTRSRPRQAAATPWRNVLRIQEAAELLPRMSDAELRELGEDIKKRGLQTPIAILVSEDRTERLLDGISRLDAMELVGLSVVVDAELNSEVVATQTVAGNIDPVGYVLSANVHRRHLTREQKAALIDRVLKVKPAQSNRAIAGQVKSDDKTVAARRKKLEATAEIPRLAKRTGADGKERKQPTKKQKKAPNTKTAVAEPVKADPDLAPKEVLLAVQLHDLLNAVWGLCQDESKWPPLGSGRTKRRTKALKNLRGAWSELVELANPAPRRGRPAKGRVS